jgi:hypothetical protein
MRSLELLGNGIIDPTKLSRFPTDRGLNMQVNHIMTEGPIIFKIIDRRDFVRTAPARFDMARTLAVIAAGPNRRRADLSTTHNSGTLEHRIIWQRPCSEYAWYLLESGRKPFSIKNSLLTVISSQKGVLQNAYWLFMNLRWMVGPKQSAYQIPCAFF